MTQADTIVQVFSMRVGTTMGYPVAHSEQACGITCRVKKSGKACYSTHKSEISVIGQEVLVQSRIFIGHALS